MLRSSRARAPRGDGTGAGGFARRWSWRAAERIALVGVSGLAGLIALDRGTAALDLAYTPARGRPNENRRLERAEFAVDMRLNALGFRDRRLPSPKTPPTTRVIALGDSFTQGFGVAEYEAWPRRLEDLLEARHARAREVINLGVPGSNPRDYLDHLRDPGLAYAPDVVIVTVMANDVQERWVQREFGVQFASGVLVDARRSVLAPQPVWTRVPRTVFPTLYALVWHRLQVLRDPPAKEAGAAADAPATPLRRGAAEAILLELADRYGRREAVEDALASMPVSGRDALRPVLEGTVPVDADAAADAYLRVMALVQPRLFADAVLLPPHYDAAWADVERQLRRIVAVARGAGARTLLVFAPAGHQVTPATRPVLQALGFRWDERTLTDTTFADRLRALARSEDIPFVDPLPVLRAWRGDGLYFPVDGHWTPAGHALIAGLIATAVETTSPPPSAGPRLRRLQADRDEPHRAGHAGGGPRGAARICRNEAGMKLDFR